MTTYDDGANAPTQTGGAAGSGDAKEQAKQAAGTAADEGKHVADVARSEAQSVAADAQEHARNLLDDARGQVEEQSRTQLDNLVSTLQGFADDLERMVRGDGPESGLARDVVTQVGEKARGLGSQLQGQEPAQVLDQVRAFARRRPGTFLLGALAAGVVAGRLTRGAKEAHGGTSTDAAPATTEPATSPEGYTSAQVSAPPAATADLPSAGAGLGTPPAGTGTAADQPLGGTGTPAAPPVYPEGSGSTAGGTP